MRSIVLLFGLGLLFLSVYPQQIHFGYPISMDDIKKGDKIILNIPIHNDGRFIPEKGIERLIEFLNIDSSFFFRIEIHFFYGSDEFADNYSKYICKNLKLHLLSECKFSNFDLYSCGKSQPIFLNKDSVSYKDMNTRMEILVE